MEKTQVIRRGILFVSRVSVRLFDTMGFNEGREVKGKDILPVTITDKGRGVLSTLLIHSTTHI